jgi:hypothetical protein
MGIDVVVELTTNRRVADLLIAMLYAAAMTPRIELCFPDPVTATIEGGFVISFRNDDGSQNLDLLRHVLSLLPSIDDMLVVAQGSEVKLQQALRAEHPLLFPVRTR